MCGSAAPSRLSPRSDGNPARSTQREAGRPPPPVPLSLLKGGGVAGAGCRRWHSSASTPQTARGAESRMWHLRAHRRPLALALVRGWRQRGAGHGARQQPLLVRHPGDSFPSWSRGYTRAHTHTRSYSHTHKHIHTLTHALTQCTTLTCTHSHVHSFAQLHTRTHTLTYALIHYTHSLTHSHPEACIFDCF